MFEQKEYFTIVKPLVYGDFVEFEHYRGSDGKPIGPDDMSFVGGRLLELRKETGLDLQMVKWDIHRGILYV